MIGDPLLLCPKQIGFANLFCLHACCPFWPIDKTYPTGYCDCSDFHRSQPAGYYARYSRPNDEDLEKAAEEIS